MNAAVGMVLLLLSLVTTDMELPVMEVTAEARGLSTGATTRCLLDFFALRSDVCGLFLGERQ